MSWLARWVHEESMQMDFLFFLHHVEPVAYSLAFALGEIMWDCAQCRGYGGHDSGPLIFHSRQKRPNMENENKKSRRKKRIIRVWKIISTDGMNIAPSSI